MEWETRSFHDLNLFDMKKREPNYQAGILIGLSEGKKFPASRRASGGDKTLISKLRISLKRLTGIKANPFHPFNTTDGYRPRFKVTNDLTLAAKRAESEATHTGFQDGKDYGSE